MIPGFNLKEVRDYINRELSKITELIRRPLGIPQYKAVTANKSLTWGEITRVDSTNGNISVFLPKVTGDILGRVVVVKKISLDDNTVSVFPTTGDTIDRQSVYEMSNPGHAAIFVAGGGQWESL